MEKAKGILKGLLNGSANYIKSVVTGEDVSLAKEILEYKKVVESSPRKNLDYALKTGLNQYMPTGPASAVAMLWTHGDLSSKKK